MQNSDLVEIISALLPDERQRLRAYLETTPALRDPARGETIRLVHFIVEGLSQNDAPEALSKKEAYGRVFPNRDFVSNKLEKCMSDTLQYVRQFIVMEMAGRQTNEVRQMVYLQAFYNERGLEDKFRQSRNHLIQKKSKEQKWSLQDYYSLFLSEAEEFGFQSSRNRKRQKDDLNIWSTIQALDEYYLVERLWYTCFLLNQNQLAPLALPALREWLPVDLNAPRFQWFFVKPLGKLFAKTIALLSGESDNPEQQLREIIALLAENEDQLTPDQANAFEIYAVNFGIRQANKGNPSWIELVFQIQKRWVESGRIHKEGKAQASEFHSIVVNGLRQGQIAWVKNFIEQHRDKIIGVMPSEDYFQFNLTYYYFQTKEYEPEIKTLLTSNYEDMIYKILGKILEIKIQYELSVRPGAHHSDANVLESKVEAAIIFFFREKNIPPDKKKMGKRFADTMKRILHASGKSDAKRLGKIREDVEGADLIADRQWLLKIIDDLMEKLKKK